MHDQGKSSVASLGAAGAPGAPPRLALIAAVTLAFGVLFGVMEAAQTHWRAALSLKPMSWADALVMAMPPWLIYGLLAPAAFVLTERFRLDHPPRWAAALVHVLFAVVFAVVHQYGVALFVVIFVSGALAHDIVLLKFQRLLTINFAIDVVVYCALVGGFHALLYYREFRRRELAASQLQMGLTQARLEALRAQLNPHFLFNTLNAISALALKGDREAVVQTLSLLSDLLRLSLDGQLPQAIPLADEIAFIDRYLELQRIRFSDRLGIRKAIDPDTLQALVPSLVLQPIVENAVLHGVAARRGPGQIEIRARRESSDLRLEIGDTGPGFETPSDAIADGMGLRNTRARLEHLYGEAHALSCQNLATGGALVTIRIPFTPAPVADAADVARGTA